MEFTRLSSTVSVRTVAEDTTKGTFEVEGLFAGYGVTLGNALRRILLSSLPGAAVTQVKIKNASHEFSTLPNVTEDMVVVSLNLKKLRFRLHTDEPQVLAVNVKGERAVTGADIVVNSNVELINPDQVIATLTAKNAEFSAELTVERGLGYIPAESQKTTEKLSIGAIALDAVFTPVQRVNFTIQDMRVGDRTDYNRLHLEIETDGSVSPSSALHKAASILKDHADKVLALGGTHKPEAAPEAKEEEKTEA